MAQPRPSIADPEITSSTSSILTLLGHKEDTVVKMVSEKLSSRLNKTVVVSAGIHWDHIDQSAIAEVLDNCLLLVEKIADVVEREA